MEGPASGEGVSAQEGDGDLPDGDGVWDGVCGHFVDLRMEIGVMLESGKIRWE